MSFLQSFFLIFTLVLYAAAQSNSCPGGRAPNRTVTATNGIRFAVCLDTDFKGGTLLMQEISNPSNNLWTNVLN